MRRRLSEGERLPATPTVPPPACFALLPCPPRACRPPRPFVPPPSPAVSRLLSPLSRLPVPQPRTLPPPALAQVIAQQERKETLREILGMLKSSRNPQVEYLARVIKKWARENNVNV